MIVGCSSLSSVDPARCCREEEERGWAHPEQNTRAEDGGLGLEGGEFGSEEWAVERRISWISLLAQLKGRRGRDTSHSILAPATCGMLL